MVSGAAGRPGDRDGLLMMDVDAACVVGRALDLEPARGRVGVRRRGAGFGCGETMVGQAERVPAKPEAAPERQEGDNRKRHGQTPARRLQRAKDGQGPHGNAFRSSSK